MWQHSHLLAFQLGMYRKQQVVVHEEALVQQVQLKRSLLVVVPLKSYLDI